ncbi:unnamed protein product, partial [Vitis vinifera]
MGWFECNRETGHVIGLLLASSHLYGSINSSSSLFSLVHLQRLDLSDNYFNHSQIPCGVGQLSRLRSLNLSYSGFSGPIPSSLVELVNLRYLSLRGNYLNGTVDLNMLKKLKNLTYLQLSNMLSLLGYNDTNVLCLSNNKIHGPIPGWMWNISKETLVTLLLSGNFLTGFEQLPVPPPSTFDYSVSVNKLSGQIPPLICNMSSLSLLDLSGNSLSGRIPQCLTNLSSSSSILNLRGNRLHGSIPQTCTETSNLRMIDLSENQLQGKIPGSLANCMMLEELGLQALNLSNNALTGPIPASLANLTLLEALDLSQNKLSREIPQQLVQLTFLEFFNVSHNHLTGPIPQGKQFATFPNTSFDGNLGFFSGELPASIGTLGSVIQLDLSSCNLTGFAPTLLGYITQLSYLDLHNNHSTSQIPPPLGSLTQLTHLDFCQVNISSPVPDTLANYSSLSSLFLENCGLSDLTGYLPEFQETSPLKLLTLAGTSFSGGLPASADNLDSLNELDISSCHFTGLVSSSIGQLSQLTHLDLSSNSFGGQIPSFWANLSQLTFLEVSSNNFSGEAMDWIALGYNNLHGPIPSSIFELLKKLTRLGLSDNKLLLRTDTSSNGTGPKFKVLGLASCNLGEFPHFLRNQDELELLKLSNNKIHGKIPKWIWNIGSLPVPPSSISTYFVENNRFTGKIPPLLCNLSLLHMLDLSNNTLSGMIPECLSNLSNSLSGPVPRSLTNCTVLENWIAMKSIDADNFTYMQASSGFSTQTYKAIDFSSNKFKGEIPTSIGTLKGLHLLNFSYNSLTGRIPTSLRNLTELEALDLSQNNLLGEIPQQLTEMTFLGFFNVSHNNLTGPIPQGKQFDTFQSDSYEGNPGLCGNPKQASPQPSTSEQGQDLEPASGFDRKVVLMGYGSGLILLLCFHLLVSMQPPCDDNDRENLLEFKQASWLISMFLRTLQLIQRLQKSSIFHLQSLQFLGMRSNPDPTSHVPEFHGTSLQTIEISSNKFSGEIQESIGNLKRLHLLNLFGNSFTGQIPSSLKNLEHLESLDLSHNKLPGEIPQQLTRIDTLEYSLFLYDNGAKTSYFSLRTLSFCITMVQLLCRSKFQRGMGHGEKEKKPRFFINDNTDILMEILKRLDGRSLGVAACVCRLWRSVTWNDSLWEHLCFRHVSPPPPGVRPVVVALGGYRRLYMMCLRPVLSRLGQMKRGDLFISLFYISMYYLISRLTFIGEIKFN